MFATGNGAARLVGMLSLVVIVLIAGCRSEPAPTPTPAGTHHWSYAGDTAPDRWALIDDEYERCATGVEQSPIELSREIHAGDGSNIEFDYQTSGLSIVNNGHTIQAVYDPGSAIVIEGERHDLLQFHLHGESEHTIDGVRFPLELHLVHRNADGGLAVVGVLIEEGAPNQALEPVFANMPREESTAPETVEGERVDAERMLPSAREMFEYPGSLTTPPCTEGVRWFVMTHTIELSSAQISAFAELYEGNYRPLQPLNDREVRMTGDPDDER